MSYHIQRQAILPYTAQQMFDLVNDVNAYPEFVPYCTGCSVLAQRQVADGEQQLEARVDLAKGVVSQSFTTCNRMRLDQSGQKMTIDMRLVSGPFKTFSGFWGFEVLSSNASKVTLDIEFEMQGGLAGMAAKIMFEKFANQLVDVFSQRAKMLYDGR